MTAIFVDNPVQRDFGMVPRAIWSLPVKHAAKACLAFLLCQRDGACPTVAEIELAVGIGRDARRKAFAELEKAGILRWVVRRTGDGRVIGKELQVSVRAVVEAAEDEARKRASDRPPENQAHGHRPPEKPAVGISVGEGADFSRSPTENQAILHTKPNIKRRARAKTARSEREHRSPPDGGGVPVRGVWVGATYHGRPRDREERKLFDRWADGMLRKGAAVADRRV